MDAIWWKVMQPTFCGEKFTASDNIPTLAALSLSKRAGNSGAGAMQLARFKGADKIILLGFDCKPAANGDRHWHGAHEKGLGNAGSMAMWNQQFIDIVEDFNNIDVVNCSPDTALKIWRQANLKDELC